MKPIFRTDLFLVILTLASLVTGIFIHKADHFGTHQNYFFWSLVHCLVNFFLLIIIASHIKQHWAWFKKLLKKSSLKRKMAVIVFVGFLLTLASGLLLLFTTNGQGTHEGIVHFWLGLTFTLLASAHLAKRWKVFKKGVSS